VRRPEARCSAEDHRRRCRAGHRQDARGNTEERHPLVDQIDGRGNGHVAVNGLADLAFALAPHRSQTFKQTFKPSTDPLFTDKVRDVVGLCLDPPEKALVLCVDEKSRIQALDRSRPVLPMVPGIPERRSHD
jgi:hypothetical protein